MEEKIVRRNLNFDTTKRKADSTYRVKYQDSSTFKTLKVICTYGNITQTFITEARNLPKDSDSIHFHAEREGCSFKIKWCGKAQYIPWIIEGQSSVRLSSPKAYKPLTASTELIQPSDAEKRLIQGKFISANELDGRVPDVPGIYCIKLRKGVQLPAKFGKVREDGIIYIGQTSKSLKERLWEEELNHKRPATFFRSIGAILGYLPPKGSLFGKKTNNYKFGKEDMESIRKWMRQSLLVNFIAMDPSVIDDTEIALIKKYSPLANIEHNPERKDELRAARKKCEAYAHSPAE